MSIRSAQSVTVDFCTSRFDTGAAANADSTPTGTLYISGTANGATVTVTNVTTGQYKAAVTLPTLAVGDIVELVIAATVNSVAARAVVWRDTTAEQNADALLARNIKGSTSTGRIVSDCFAAQRNKVAFDVPAAGQFTVFDTDDSTALWTGTYATSAVNPVTSIDPS